MSAPLRLGRLWPRGLRHQMVLLLALVMLATMALLYKVSATRLGDVAYDATQYWAESVARTAASAGSPALAHADYATLETTLRDIATLPGVMRIDVTDADNAPLLSVLQAPNGRVTARYRSADMPRPESGASRSRALRVGQTDALQVWSPAGPGGSLGSVGVTFALDAQRSSVQRLRFDAVAAIAFVGLLTLGAAWLLLDRALGPLQRAVRFSRVLPDRPGDTLEQAGGSHEVADLTDALNHASRTLDAQLAEIRASKERTQAILDAVPDALIGMDAQGHVVLVSPAAASVFGIDPSAPVLPTIDALVPGLVASELAARTQAGLYMRSSGAQIARFETNARRVDGTEFPADVSLSRTEHDGVARFTCVVRDITEQRMTYSMLNLYSRALECTTNGVVISDMSLPGQPVFYANPAFYRITGYDPGEAIGRNCAFLQREDRDQPELDTLREAVVAGQSASVVLRNYRKDGSLFFNELSIAPVTAADGSVPHYVGVLSDVTERERTRLAIAERSARLNAVFDLSPDGFVVFDRDAQLVYANRAFVAMTGIDPAADGQTMDLAAFDRRFAQLCAPSRPYPPAAQALCEGSTDAVTLDLERPQRRVLQRHLRHQDDGLGETIVYLRDITHETEVDRMKSEFLTTAAHELRTPMVSVFGFTELLLRRPVPEERRRDMLETIHRQASLLIHMVNELLDLARIEARQGKDLKRQPCRLGDLLAQATAAFTSQPGGERLSVARSHDEVQLHVDPEKTHRVLTNVLSNAFKYSPQGGPIEVDCLRGTVGDADAVGVRVRDSGIGMTPEQLARVCERFYRADPSGNIPGTGLGMSLVKEIVELQGGRVEISSVFGEGTQVTIWLPVHMGVAVTPP